MYIYIYIYIPYITHRYPMDTTSPARFVAFSDALSVVQAPVYILVNDQGGNGWGWDNHGKTIGKP